MRAAPASSDRLLRAVEDNDLATARAQLERGVRSPNAMQAAVGHAVASGDTTAIALLLAFGADPNVVDHSTQQTPLTCAAELGDLALVRALLAAGADPHHTDGTGEGTALDFAADAGRYAVVELLFAATSSPDTTRGGEANRALPEALLERMLVAAGGREDPEALTSLLDRAPHLAANTRRMSEAWRRAALGPWWQTMQAIEARAAFVGCPLDAPHPDVVEAWVRAAGRGQLAMMTHLQRCLEPGPGVEAIDAALKGGARNGHLAVVDVLLARGPSDVGKAVALATATESGVARGHGTGVPIVERLLDAGVDPNAAPWGDGVTPLMRAVRLHDVAVMQLLLARGADVHARDARGRSAMAHTPPSYPDDARALLAAHGAAPEDFAPDPMPPPVSPPAPPIDTRWNVVQAWVLAICVAVIVAMLLVLRGVR